MNTNVCQRLATQSTLSTQTSDRTILNSNILYNWLLEADTYDKT